ncbi:MAG: DUF6088 family protein [Planctomycetota bacterium]|jgi:hypothetical protein
MQSIQNKVLSRIYGNGRGWAFFQKDFSDFGSRSAIDNALTRLERKGPIRRVIRGIYDYPRYSELLMEQLSPDLNQVAKALARKHGWRIQPSGPAAMNIIGLSTQVPAKVIYLSDGPNRSYKIGNQTLAFENTALKDSGFKLTESSLIVQSLKSLGQNHLTNEVINTVRKWLKPELRLKVLKDTRASADWIYEAIKKICREGDHE